MRHFLVLFTALLLVAPLQAEKGKDKAKGAEKERSPLAARPWTVDDYLYAEGASDLQPSPDGKSLAWVLHKPNDDLDEKVAHLMLTGLDDEFEVQLTRGTDSASHPRWSPDGRRLAFLSARPDTDAGEEGATDEPHEQLWLLDLRGGEPRAVTSLERDVVDFGWKDDDTIVFVAPEAATLYEQDLEEKQDASIAVEDAAHEPPVRLFSVGVEDGTVTRLSTNNDWIESVSVSPDGKYAVTVHAKSLSFEYDGKTIPETHLFDLESLKSERILAEGRFIPTKIEWDPKSDGFYAAYSFSTDMSQFEATVTRLAFFDASSRKRTEIQLGSDWGLSYDPNEYLPTFAAMKDGVVALIANGAVNKPAFLDRDGMKWTPKKLEAIAPDEIYDVRSFPDGGSLLTMRSTPNSPDAWRVAMLDGGKLKESEDAVLQAQADFAEKVTAKAELVRWKGALGEDIEGVLHFPKDYLHGQAYPLIVNIHGGPFGVDFLCWNASWYDLTDFYSQRGAFVFNPNYHGSSNYGLAFAESIAHGKYYEYPTDDIEKGIAHLVEMGYVDPARVALKGWSNGAILTLALIARSPNYVAASSGAGGAEWTADWGACAFGEQFNRFYFGSSPIENPDLYRQLAPLYNFAKVRTPLIVFHGDADTAVPAHHGWLQYRALQQVAKTPVKLVLFPGEEHSLAKLSHHRRKMEEEIAWFDKYLFKESQTLPTRGYVLAGSPLDGALRRAAAVSTEDGVLGQMLAASGKPEPVLVPDIVEWEGVSVARFEITRAQFAEFERSKPVGAYEANLPATDITVDQANKYCAWLSELTGKTYRLPNEDESDILYGGGDGEENTLDRWAGYAVGPDDALRLRLEIARLGGTAPLLRPVGSFSASIDSADPKAAVFDLGGNAAEWITLDSGEGELRGGSADQPADAKTKSSAAPPDYRGFRVVVEGPK